MILETLANVNLQKDLELIAPGGRIVVVGSRGKIEVEPRLLMTREALVTGLMLANAAPDELVEIHAALVDGLVSGELAPVVGKEFQLEEAPAAHQAVMAPGHCGKIVLVP